MLALLILVGVACVFTNMCWVLMLSIIAQLQSITEPSSSLTLVNNFAIEQNVLVNAPNVNPLTAGMYERVFFSHTCANALVTAPISYALLVSLREFMRSQTAMFSCPEQATAVNAALNLQKDLLICLPTGCGKTLCFLLPVFIYKRIPGRHMMTIVIVPLVALTFNLKARCRQAGITFTTWKGK